MKISQFAKDAVKKLPPDILMHPMPLQDRLDYAEKIVQEAIDEAKSKGFNRIRYKLKEASKDEPNTWGFVALFMGMIDEAEKETEENA